MELLDYSGHPIRQDAYIIRATELGQFINCPRNWFFTSHNGLNLEAQSRNRKLRFGIAWHLAMEYLYSGRPTFDGLEEGFRHEEDLLAKRISAFIYDPDIQAELEEDKELGHALLTSYLEWRKQEADPSDSVLYPYAVERRFVVPLPGTRAYIAVRLDAEFLDERGALWIMEHKTRGKSTNVSNPPPLQLDLQTGIQIWALQKAQPEKVVRGVIYNLARKQTPGPRVKSPIFGRHAVERSSKELDILEQYFKDVYYKMRPYLALKRYIQNGGAIDKAITKTLYNPNQLGILCESANRGEDVEYLIDTQLVPREKNIWQVLEEELSE